MSIAKNGRTPYFLVYSTMKLTKPLLIDSPPEKWNFEDLPSYRVSQIQQWVFEKGTLHFEEMSNLPANLRQRLQEEYDLNPMEIAREQGSVDTTQKFLWKLRDHQFIESVLIPATEGTKGGASLPPDPLCFHSGGVCFGVQILCQRTGWAEKKPLHW